MKSLIRILSDYVLIEAMLIGGLLYKFFVLLSPITSSLIFLMLFVTFVKTPAGRIHILKSHYIYAFLQISLSIGAYFCLYKINIILAQSAMICLLCPTATSAPVVTSILKGNTRNTTIYLFMINVVVAISAPFIFSLINPGNGLSFWNSFIKISTKVGPLILLPLLFSYFVRNYMPKTKKAILHFKKLSFYLWAFALSVVTGKTVFFIVNQQTQQPKIEILIAIVSLFLCVFQFIVGKFIGSKVGDKIAGGQSLGQKNTILAIWMAQSYLNPIASIAPAAYVLWQNIINSTQIYMHNKKNIS